MNSPRDHNREATSRVSEERGDHLRVAGFTQGSADDLGGRIRGVRKGQSLRLIDVAHRSGYSVSFLSQVERGLAQPSVGALKRLANALGVSGASLLFGFEVESGREMRPTRPDIQKPRVVRRDRRKSIAYPGSPITYELVVPDLRQYISVLWLEAEPGATSGKEPFVHSGEECVMVITGSLEISVGDEAWTLKDGDSIYFRSEFPHRWINPGRRITRAIWISSPPTF